MSSTSEAVIHLDGIGKCYRIYGNPQDRFKQALRDRFGAWRAASKDSLLYREHWALRDVSFTINKGEAVGILGRNGAGKSTLLQVIAGTIAATTGQVETNGRITAMLELGSGFNPEFSGRENVFHNAQILGLARSEIESKIDDILAFAEIGDFVDQPVKTYSSGMMMRLAFSVQTVLDPTILIVDEALAVGDARFQEKCFRKLRQLRDRGVSILLVTHDVNSVTSFCDRAILMEAGSVLTIGKPDAVAKHYLEVLYGNGSPAGNAQPVSIDEAVAQDDESSGMETENQTSTWADELAQTSGRFGNKKAEIVDVGIFTPDGERVAMVTSGQKYRIRQRVKFHDDVDYLSTGFMIRTVKSVDIFGVTNKSCGQSTLVYAKKGQIFDVSVDVDLWLGAGDYILHVANAGESGEQYDCVPSALTFTVLGTPNLFSTSIVNLNPTFNVTSTL